ncbi:MAG TPA: hypothetical protein VLC09_09170 [Polyangiaceae bacterium]|nr:hypothetical protein [Polyangiaceae bacterium]
MKLARPLLDSTSLCLGLALLTGCSKKEETPPAPEATAPGANSTPAATPAEAPNQAPAEAAAAAGPVSLDCGSNGWERIEVKALQDGGISVPAEGATFPQFSFAACDDLKDCGHLTLSENQKLLAVGQNGNDVRLAIAQTCSDDVVVWLADGTGKVVSGFRGHDIAMDKAVLGGDRLLLSGIARHRSPTAEDGFVPREYLFTVRSSAPKKVEVARNKQGAVPLAAASQIVVVDVGGTTCTTMFWKLGVEECDFQGPASDEWATFGSHIVFADGGAGKTYGTKAGQRDLLPALDWIVTDGVNVAWSAAGALTMTQPKFDLPELAGTPAPGAAGAKPLAIGCQRLLAREGDEYHLRNVKLGSEWRFPANRLPEDSGAPAALGCDKLYTDAGYTLGLGTIGKPVPLADAAAAAPAGATAAPGGAPSPAPATSAAPPAPSPSAAK